jgi:C4-dicarboxylate transporter DctQ subunit
MAYLHRFSDLIEKVLNTLGGVLIGISTLLAVIEVVCRYLLRFTHSWANEIIIYSAIYGVFFIAGPSLKRGIHINIDLLVARLSPERRRVMDWVANAAGFVTSLFLTYTGVQYVAYLKKIGVISTSSLQAPMYLILLIFPLGMGLLAFFYFEQLTFLLFGSGKPGDSVASAYRGEL